MPQSALVLFAPEPAFAHCCQLFVLPACTPKLLLGLLPWGGVSARKLEPAGSNHAGGIPIYRLQHSPGQGPAVSRDSSSEV